MSLKETDMGKVKTDDEAARPHQLGRSATSGAGAASGSDSGGVNHEGEPAMIVTAQYQGKMDERREQRIHAAFKRCDVQTAAHSAYVLKSGDGSEIPVMFTNVEWTSNEDGTDTELTIYVDGCERATRLASELRACGLMASTKAAAE
jgi:hypothetical protein